MMQAVIFPSIREFKHVKRILRITLKINLLAIGNVRFPFCASVNIEHFR